MARRRNDLYYIEQFSNNPAVLYADGSIGQLEFSDVEVTEKETSRRPDRERIVTKTIKRLGQTAVYNSLADYVAWINQERDSNPPNAYDSDWTIDDMPDSVLERCSTWEQSLVEPSIESIRTAAYGMIASPNELEEATIPCVHCSGDSQYACRVCGYARNFYAYPLVRLGVDGNDTTLDVPFDVARVVALNPHALTLTTEYSFPFGKMAADRVLTFHLDHISPEYINAVDDGTVSTDPSDKMRRDVRLVVHSWNEREGGDAIKPYMSRYSNKTLPQTPEEYIQAMQFFVSEYVEQEVINDDVYQKRYELLQQRVAKLGKGAVALVFQYKYAGMGETDARFSLTGTGQEYNKLQVLTYSGDVRFGIDDALEWIDTYELTHPS